MFSFRLWLNPYSLDCRHAFCGLCIANWFATRHDNTCPECRAVCQGYPQRDYALQDILPKVYATLEPKRDPPDHSSILPQLFNHIYQMLAVYKAGEFTREEEKRFWGPLIAEVEQLRGVQAEIQGAPGSSSNVIDVDEDFEMDNSQDPDFEPDSDAESGEGRGDGRTDVEQDEGETGLV